VSEPLCIPIDKLRRAFDLLMQHVSTVEGDCVRLDQDYFWSIPPQERYNVYQEPMELTIGQLSESWQHLDELLADESKALSYHLAWLADVLRAVGEKTVR
jgi:uncharacterized membrane protein YccC